MNHRTCRAGVVAVAATVAASVTWANNPNQPPAPNWTNTFNAPGNQLTGKPNVVVLAHGWTSAPRYWSTDMRTNILNRLGLNAAQWDVWALDWETDGFDTNATGPLRRTEINASVQGRYISAMLRTNQGSDPEHHLQHVHLIGHSLGGRVVETASNYIRQWSDATIQTTFADAYTPYDWDLIYGSHSTWSDNYIDRDEVAFTQQRFPLSRNVDVTALRTPMPANYLANENPPLTQGQRETSWRHNWPRVFYDNTVRDIYNNNANIEPYGHELSKEFLGANWPANGHARGRYVTITPNAAPVETAVGQNVIGRAFSVGLGEDAIKASSGENVTIDDGVITFNATRGDSGVTHAWATIPFTTGLATNFVEFDFKFLDRVAGTLSMYIDNDPTNSRLMTLRGEHSLDGWEESGMIMTGAWSLFGAHAPPLARGPHTIKFRLDIVGDDVMSIRAQVRDISGGFVIPAPGSLMMLGAAALLAGRRRRVGVAVE